MQTSVGMPMGNMNYVEAAAEALEMAEAVVASEVATEIVEVVVMALEVVPCGEEVDMVEVVVVTIIFTLVPVIKWDEIRWSQE